MRRQNKVIMSGLALYHDVDPEGCGACNFDVSWLFNYPSTLLWTDKIIVTPTILKIGQVGGGQAHHGDNAEIVSDVVRMFFDVIGTSDLFEVKYPKATLTKKIIDTIEEQAVNDRNLLGESFPGEVNLDVKEKLPGGFALGKVTYCIPRVITTYLAVALAGAWEAQVILTSDAHHLLKYLFGLRVHPLERGQSELNAFTEILKGHLPEIDIRPHSICWNCKHGETCDKHDRRTIELRLREYLRWREYDEVIQMKALFSQLSEEVQSTTLLELTDDLVRAFREEERKISKKLTKVFPQIERWSSVITIASIPIVVAGVTGSAPLIAGLGAAVAGVGQIAKHYVDYLTSKHRWVFFRQAESGFPDTKKDSRRRNDRV